MSNIIKLNENSSSDLILVRKSLIGLRRCYPEFGKWYDDKVIPNLKDNSRRVFLATQYGEFSGALILKKTEDEKKVCTLFINEQNRFHHIGSDFLRIASEELETYKLPITVSDEAKDWFFNNKNFNFYTKETCDGLYNEDTTEYLGYIMYHNPDNDLKFRSVE